MLTSVNKGDTQVSVAMKELLSNLQGIKMAGISTSHMMKWVVERCYFASLVSTK